MTHPGIGPTNLIGHHGGLLAHKLGFPYGWAYAPASLYVEQPTA